MPALFDRLRADAGEAWAAYVDHEFVRGLDAGTLPLAAFRHYLVQDYLFLQHLARAYGLAAYKSSTQEELEQAAGAMNAIAAVEIAHHIAFCARHGVDRATLQGSAEDLATTAYSRYVLDVGQAGDLLDLHAALAPCVVGYGEIGKRLGPARPGHPFRDWIEMYAGETYQAVARGERAMLDRLGAARGADARMAGLSAIFTQATRLETAFWDMALRAAPDEVGKR